METAIVVAPLFDNVTVHTFDESRDAKKYAEGKGVKVIDLPKEFAIREKVEAVLETNPGVLLYHANHGNTDKIWGNDDRPVIDLKNVGLLAGRESYNNNCSSAKELGYEAWRKGCLAYWGNIDVFTFTTDALPEFKEAVNYGFKRRVDGFSWKECLDKTKHRMTELIDLLVDSGRGLAAACMRHDRDILVCYTPEMPPEDLSCPFSQLIAWIFGFRTLVFLRRIRDKLWG